MVFHVERLQEIAILRPVENYVNQSTRRAPSLSGGNGRVVRGVLGGYGLRGKVPKRLVSQTVSASRISFRY
jgi:hypothetical protein